MIIFLFFSSSLYCEQSRNIQFNGGPLILQCVLKSRGLDFTIQKIADGTHTLKGNTALNDMNSFLKSKKVESEIRSIPAEQIKKLLKDYDLVGVFGGNKRFVWIQEISDTHIKFYDQGFRTKDRIHRLPLKAFQKEIDKEFLIIKKNKGISK